jgi:hypothetical protein
MATVNQSTIRSFLKETVDTVVDDDLDGAQSKAVFTKWCDVKDMDDAWIEDVEMGGTGLASEKSEGQEMASATIVQGVTTRYNARTFALKLLVSEEAMDDNKYPEVIRAALRLKKSMWKTADIDATSMLVRMANSSYTGGDGQALSSASHTLPHGGTFSNKMAVAMSPSHAALVSATSQVMQYPGHDGIIEGAEITQILCPVAQWAVWEGLMGSSLRPDDGNFAEINVFNKKKIKVTPIKYWINTTTNWVAKTDVENGLQFRWRKRPKSSSWFENDFTVMKYGITARWAFGWSDPRGVLCVEA